MGHLVCKYSDALFSQLFQPIFFKYTNCFLQTAVTLARSQCLPSHELFAFLLKFSLSFHRKHCFFTHEVGIYLSWEIFILHRYCQVFDLSCFHVSYLPFFTKTIPPQKTHRLFASCPHKLFQSSLFVFPATVFPLQPSIAFY